MVVLEQRAALSGVPITLTATVSPTGSDRRGLVQGRRDDDRVRIGSVLSAPVATCKTSSLAVGTHSITAVYAGDAGLAGQHVTRRSRR